MILFSNAYIIGGSPCSGKSTIAEILTAEFQFPYYKVDDHEEEHMARSALRPDQYPIMARLAEMDWDEIWSRPVSEQVVEELAFYRERFQLILEDLAQFDPQRRIILEGAAYLPELIRPYKPNHVLYMVPTMEFQRYHYQKRPWIKGFLEACADPDQAFDNWMMRDHLFGQEILRQAHDSVYNSIIVDGREGVEEQYTAVVNYFGLLQ